MLYEGLIPCRGATISTQVWQIVRRLWRVERDGLEKGGCFASKESPTPLAPRLGAGISVGYAGTPCLRVKRTSRLLPSEAAELRRA